MKTNKRFDVITIGRSSVDLYGTQVGGRLEDMGSFQKYIGGSPTNIAIGCARLELKSALISRVGDEHMGRFVTEELKGEGVDTAFVKIDPKRLTALVLLGIRNKEEFPLIFYRENCADMAICEDDIDPNFIKSSRSLILTGTHLSNRNTEAALVKAIKIAKKNGVKIVLDIDFRPNLWGLSGHNDGENRYIKSHNVTKKIQQHLHYFDLIVGTEEEFRIAGGSSNTIQSLKNIRQISGAVLICKRGPLGATCFSGAVPNKFSDGKTGKSFRIEVFNVLGAGDGFMAGLLRGWLNNEKWSTSLTYANACGALAVSRHGCAPAYPSLKELNFFLNNPIKCFALRNDKELEQWHWSTNRKNIWSNLKVFAFDHRVQFETMKGSNEEKIIKFKLLCLKAVKIVSKDFVNCGILCDLRYGAGVLSDAESSGLWIGRPAERPTTFPLEFETEVGLDCGGLREWPKTQVVKVLCYFTSNSDFIGSEEQERKIIMLFEAARRNRLEFLLELIPIKKRRLSDINISNTMQRCYDLGVYPDWWKLEGYSSKDVWTEITATINKNDPNIRGILILGLGGSVQKLKLSFRTLSKFSLIKGFAIGRTIFQEVAESWMIENITDKEALAKIVQNYTMLCKAWEEIRK